MQFPQCVRRWERWTELGRSRVHEEGRLKPERLGSYVAESDWDPRKAHLLEDHAESHGKGDGTVVAPLKFGRDLEPSQPPFRPIRTF